ncbi:nitroreductase family protein, partial [Enterococcus faecium]|uniref:nitroreductase family protein n=1 Tax=Enterococcus faecium TaxID=1352 RepID=UPI001E501C81
NNFFSNQPKKEKHHNNELKQENRKEQSNGIATANTWVALVDKGLGANLQHYNPVIDEAVAKEWNIPSNWKLRSQLVFGSPETPAGEKEYMNDADRFRVFG